MKTEYNKILDQERATARILEVLIKYQHSARAVTRQWYLPRIKRTIPITCTSRGFTSIWHALHAHVENLTAHGYSPEAIEYSKADVIDMALLQLNAD